MQGGNPLPHHLRNLPVACGGEFLPEQANIFDSPNSEQASQESGERIRLERQIEELNSFKLKSPLHSGLDPFTPQQLAVMVRNNLVDSFIQIPGCLNNNTGLTGAHGEPVARSYFDRSMPPDKISPLEITRKEYGRKVLGETIATILTDELSRYFSGGRPVTTRIFGDFIPSVVAEFYSKYAGLGHRYTSIVANFFCLLQKSTDLPTEEEMQVFLEKNKVKSHGINLSNKYKTISLEKFAALFSDARFEELTRRFHKATSSGTYGYSQAEQQFSKIFCVPSHYGLADIFTPLAIDGHGKVYSNQIRTTIQAIFAHVDLNLLSGADVVGLLGSMKRSILLASNSNEFREVLVDACIEARGCQSPKEADLAVDFMLKLLDAMQAECLGKTGTLEKHCRKAIEDVLSDYLPALPDAIQKAHGIKVPLQADPTLDKEAQELDLCLREKKREEKLTQLRCPSYVFKTVQVWAENVLISAAGKRDKSDATARNFSFLISNVLNAMEAHTNDLYQAGTEARERGAVPIAVYSQKSAQLIAHTFRLPDFYFHLLKLLAFDGCGQRDKPDFHVLMQPAVRQYYKEISGLANRDGNIPLFNDLLFQEVFRRFKLLSTFEFKQHFLGTISPFVSNLDMNGASSKSRDIYHHILNVLTELERKEHFSPQYNGDYYLEEQVHQNAGSANALGGGETNRPSSPNVTEAGDPADETDCWQPEGAMFQGLAKQQFLIQGANAGRVVEETSDSPSSVIARQADVSRHARTATMAYKEFSPPRYAAESSRPDSWGKSTVPQGSSSRRTHLETSV